ncbi:MAG: hypothetical protein OXF88_20670 [Rhodobacteraceae bacterium]|nr:hypothetical protein [Paracoccaceae bacterium]MCY4139774.1 hypothetical protein [Paracoccaceae bacterium]
MMRPTRQRRGFAVLSTLVALLIAAAVLDRVLATVATDRNEAAAAAAFTAVRSIAEAAAVLDSDPVAAGVLPHLPVRRDLEFTYTEDPATPDEMRFDWSGLPHRAAVVLENRLAEWLSRDRVSGPLVLALTDVPLPYPRRVLRFDPSMQAALTTAGIQGIGTLNAATATWEEGESVSVTVAPPVAGGDAGVVAGDVTVAATLMAPRLAVRHGMGDPDPVTMVLSTPPAGQDALRVKSLSTGALSVAKRLEADSASIALTARTDALAPEDGVALDLAGASFADGTLGSARVAGTVTGTLDVTTCIGCTP